MEFLRQSLGTLDTVEELAAAAEMVKSARTDGIVRQELLNLYSQRLATLRGGDRQFQYAVGKLQLGAKVEQLAETAKAAGLAVDGLIAGYRAFLVAHLGGTRCADSVKPPEAAGSRESTDARLVLNRKLARFSDGKEIAESEVRPGRVVPGAEFEALPIGDFKGVLSRLIKRQNAPAGARSDFSEIEGEVRELLHRFDSQDDPKSSDTAYFHAKTAVLQVLIPVTDGPVRQMLIEGFVRLLEQDPMHQTSPIEWLMPARALVNLTRSLGEEERQYIDDLRAKGRTWNFVPVENGSEVRNAMRRSRNNVLAAYAVAEDAAPSPFLMPRP